MSLDAGLQKAYILDTTSGNQLACRFNPKEYTISKSSTWTRPTTPSATQTPTPEFRNPDPRSLSMELFLDGWESPSGDVSTDVETLFGMTVPTSSSLDQRTPQPPVVAFMWGTKPIIKGFIKQVSARYNMFKSDGTPVRATLNVTVEEIPDDPARTNPTSGGPAGRRTHTVVDGDSLQSVAYQEFGDAGLWRALADLNGIDDPLSLSPGQSLFIPNAAEAVEWT